MVSDTGTSECASLLLRSTRTPVESSSIDASSFDTASPLHLPPSDSSTHFMAKSAPRGMPSYTCVSHHVLSKLFPVSVTGDVDLVTLPVDHWPAKSFQRLAGADTAALLRADARGSGVRVGPSTIPGGGRGVFATRDFKVGERFLPFFGQIVYESLEAAVSSQDALVRSSRYGTAAFSTTALNWAKTAVEVQVHGRFWEGAAASRCSHMRSTKVTSRKRATRCYCRRSVWVVPCDCCAAGVVNDYRAVHEVDTDGISSGIARTANAVLVQQWDPISTAAELTKAGAIHLLVTADIRKGGEVCLDYGEDYGYY